MPHMLTGLGDAWVSDTLAFKKYPGCAYIDTTMDALFEILGAYQSRHGRSLENRQVASVEVQASLLTVEMDNLSAEHTGDELSQVNINFSIPYNVAIGLVAGRHTGHELRSAFLALHEREIRRLADLVQVKHDWEMTLSVAAAFNSVLGHAGATQVLAPLDYLRVGWGYSRELGGRKKNSVGPLRLLSAWPSVARAVGRSIRARRARRLNNKPLDLSHVDFTRFKAVFPAKVTVELHDGQRLSARRDVPLGAPGAGGFSEVVEEKLRIEAGAVLGTRVDEAIARLREFEECSLEELTLLVCTAQNT